MNKKAGKNGEEIEKNVLGVEISHEMLYGKYANIARFTHTKNEFVLDFFFRAGADPAVLVSRLITNPEHMKRVAHALNENIEIYEKEHGKIAD
jgi:hypothetical protein